ncbi:hypothetical protein [Paractinoplanes globisporus]|jgi:hypothetical protein|uniref:Uncharacterized protein n=1 Tax=Paractinoplanes globisporus TaxID=113565 RepID=A0ABW6W6S9_9ACTN|nr:hypothetical protein [Actinoplanes globisporus]
MLVTELALVAESARVSASQLNRVAAALQKQAIRDFEPIWEIKATVDAFTTLDDVPIGYWPIIVQDDIGQPGASGVHLDQNGQPFALVEYSEAWSLTASHEALEMLADPFGNRLIAGDSPQPGQGRVEFLVEVADPTEAAEFGYTVNGMLVSDFLTPNFYDPQAAPGVRYTFGGHLDGPRKIARGGYMSWHDPSSDHWWQQLWFNGDPEFRDLGRLTNRVGSLREAVDAATGSLPRLVQSVPASTTFASVLQASPAVKTATTSRADALRAQIEQLRAGTAPAAEWVDPGDAPGVRR